MRDLSAQSIGRALAVLIAALAPVIMAMAQARVIYDRAVMVHPSWSPLFLIALAVGVELVILTTGLAIVVRGATRKLVAGELFLIGMSVLVAVTTVIPEAWAAVLPLTIALVPVQYMVAFHAAHELHQHWYGSGAACAASGTDPDAETTAATAPTSAAMPPSAEVAPMPAPAPAAHAAPTHAGLNGHGGGAVSIPMRAATLQAPAPPPRAARRPAASQAKLTPERYRALAAEHVPAGTGAQEADRIVARVVGTSAKTAQRARLAAASSANGAGVNGRG